MTQPDNSTPCPQCGVADGHSPVCMHATGKEPLPVRLPTNTYLLEFYAYGTFGYTLPYVPPLPATDAAESC